MPEMQETQVQPRGWDDPLAEERATRSSIFARRILRTEEPGRPQYIWLQRVGHDWACTHAYAWTLPACIVLASRTMHWEIPCWPRAGFGEQLAHWVIHSFIHVSSKRLIWLEKVLFLGNALFPKLGHSAMKSQGQSHYTCQNCQELRVHKGFWQM